MGNGGQRLQELVGLHHSVDKAGLGGLVPVAVVAGAFLQSSEDFLGKFVGLLAGFVQRSPPSPVIFWSMRSPLMGEYLITRTGICIGSFGP